MHRASDQQAASHGLGNITAEYTGQGRAARQACAPASSCPYAPETEQARLWGYGWGHMDQVIAQLTFAGAKARQAGHTLKDNPYRLGTIWCGYWAAGWRSA